ncbi:MAG: hypothetical protein M3P93_12575 [Actinomycetota bacterium]|nr:hypothetical protein [Actinomycetota bacterium]
MSEQGMGEAHMGSADTPGGEAICSRCDGSGQADGQGCPECGGTGKVVEPAGGA